LQDIKSNKKRISNFKDIGRIQKLRNRDMVKSDSESSLANENYV